MGSDDHQAHPGLGLEPGHIEQADARTFECWKSFVYIRVFKKSEKKGGYTYSAAQITIPAAISKAMKLKNKEVIEVAIRRPPK